MNAVFRDLQEPGSRIDGLRVDASCVVSDVLRPLKGRPPFLCELGIEENGAILTIGVSEKCAVVQFSTEGGSYPSAMAVGSTSIGDEDFVEFMCGDTPTPISSDFCLAWDTLDVIVTYFLRHGTRMPSVHWVVI